MSVAKPRVYFVNRYFYPDESATAQLLTELAFGLSERGFEIHVICSRQRYDAPAAQLPNHELIRGVTIHRLWTTRFGRYRLVGRALDYASFYIACTVALISRLRPADIVVAKTDPPLISLFAAACATFRKAILINWLQDIFPEVASQLGANPLPAGLNRVLRRLRDASLRAAIVNVVLGSRMREYLCDQGVPPEKIQIIENWADADLHAKTAGNSALRAHLSLQHQFVVGYSGNLGRAHEYLTLLGAAETLRGDEEVTFLMIGGGVKMDALKSEVVARKLPNVHFLPHQPRVRLSDSLSAADLHLVTLIPALEGLIVPSKFYGILAAGRPVVFIGDPDGELARVIRRGNCGVTVECGDTEALVDAIRYLMGNVSHREAMGASSRALSDGYSMKRAQDIWAALLEETQRPLTDSASHSR
jgi:colanic acid biosynthesis glycosyl transferase WcaI